MKEIRNYLFLVILLFGTVFINSCKKDPVLPTLTTSAVKNVTINSVTAGGSITNDGGEAVTARGVCYGTATNPVVSGTHTTDGAGTGTFESNITGLSPNTKYYLRAYATNSVGTAYGTEVTFTTSPIVAPTLTTVDVTSITLNSAVSGGNISADGGGEITAKGLCWSTTANPTIANDKTINGTGSGNFTGNLSNLTPGTKYYLRAYATNSAGTGYGNEVSFTTSPVVLATLTTTAATNITLTSAITGGNITDAGGGSVTARGICWATTANPTITGNKTSDGTGIGSFVTNLTGLLPGTTYHIRAYATNNAGTAYGADLTFTTSQVSVPTLTTNAITEVTLTTATSGGSITTDGGAEITAKGICWATTAAPTVNNSKTIDGTGSAAFTSHLTSLLPGTVYYVRAYATNSAGTAYGNEVSFTTGQIVIPVLTTTAVTSVTQTGAASGGTITNDGGGNITAKGVCWATTTQPTTSNFITTDGTGSAAFTSTLAGLQPGTTYYLRAYATNSAGTAYGNEVSFTTDAILVPTVSTAAVTGTTTTAAVSGGNVASDGGGAVTERGVCWATTLNPTISNSKTSDGTGTGSFVSSITGLHPATTYHVRAFATNSAGTAYGDDITFTTNAIVLPTITTTTITAIGLTTAVSGGNISSDGGGAVTARGVCWSISANPTINSSKTVNGSGTGTFSSNLTNLTPGTTYYVRAYAINSAGTAYGNELTFTTTAPSLAQLTTTAVTGITLNTASSGGSITDDGGTAVTARGVCWSTSTNPTTSGSRTIDGTGTGTFTSSITGLVAGTTYYLRAYATTGAGTAYGNEISFTTLPAALPTVTTAAITNWDVTTASAGGNVTADGGGIISARGVCWATTPNPTTSNFTASAGTGTGAFTANITGLTSATTYYIRAYATNGTGTSYGNQIVLVTKVADVDGNTYKVVNIGAQTWMAENLKATRYNDGTVIPTTTNDVSGETTPRYQWVYLDNPDNTDTYGRLYTWYVASDTRNVCPTGWHVPTNDELEGLKDFLGGESVAGEKLKETGLTHWATPNTGATNETGFTALPAGFRNVSGSYASLTLSAYFWSSSNNTFDPTLGWGQGLFHDSSVMLVGGYWKADGISIRCLKD